MCEEAVRFWDAFLSDHRLQLHKIAVFQVAGLLLAKKSGASHVEAPAGESDCDLLLNRTLHIFLTHGAFFRPVEINVVMLSTRQIRILKEVKIYGRPRRGRVSQTRRHRGRVKQGSTN